MSFRKCLIFVSILTLFISCKRESSTENSRTSQPTVEYAKGFTIDKKQGYSILTVKNPWPKASKTYTYILKEKKGIVPAHLSEHPVIMVPVKRIVVTSTTHIPSLEMLNEVHSLIGFPNLELISSNTVRKRINEKKVKELGTNNSLNTEVLIDLQPDVIIGYGIDEKNPILDNLHQSGLKVMLNGDWNEQTPLGKAEWIKFFGALYGKTAEANKLFDSIRKEYLQSIEIAKKATTTPTVLAGDMFEDCWYLPKGTSWGSQLLKEANAHYLWQETSGTGSLSLSFETVFMRAKNADFWFTSGQFSSLGEMKNANPHYEQFTAFQNKKVYSFAQKKGSTGGILYYELAPNRPDLVIKDLIKILHPELLPNYQPFFFQKLK
jgi:iron complex transport system substrate-binding protein